MTMAAMLPETTSHLRRLASGLLVPAVSGKRTFVSERSRFPGFFDDDFEEYRTNVPGEATPECLADIYEQARNGKFKEIIGSFNLDPKLLFWKSQDQALEIVERHPEHLNLDGWGTFFPFLAGGKAFVARVDRYGRGLRAHVYRFDHDYVWFAENGPRFAFPQLAG